MLIITVELVPHGNLSKKRLLARALIANDGTGDEQTGNYTFNLSKRGKPYDVWRAGRIEGFPRKRLGPWDLLYRVLRAELAYRNPDDKEQAS